MSVVLALISLSTNRLVYVVSGKAIQLAAISTAFNNVEVSDQPVAESPEREAIIPASERLVEEARALAEETSPSRHSLSVEAIPLSAKRWWLTRRSHHVVEVR